MLETRAEVIEIGPSAWDDEKEPRAREGEKVMITKYAGVFVIGIHDEQNYRLVNDRDIFCVLEEKPNE
jgi:co-chaperonin GroES (HSP10)